jgi:hypothetical protein
MRTLLYTTSVLLLSVSSCLAQVSTMGTTAMGVPTTPGAIVSSPLTGPGPFTSLFSAATVPGAPATTLASPPLAQNPTIPGTSVNCAPMMVELSPSVMRVNVHERHRPFRFNRGDEFDGHDRHARRRAGDRDNTAVADNDRDHIVTDEHDHNPVADPGGGRARDHHGLGRRQFDRDCRFRVSTRRLYGGRFVHICPRKYIDQCRGVTALYARYSRESATRNHSVADGGP